MTKQEIISNESEFQRACSRYVERNVIYCVSSLMYDIGQNLEQCSKIFDFDYDEALGWFQRDDWEEPVWEHIRDLDQDEVVEYLEDHDTEFGPILSLVSLQELMFEHIKTEDELQDYANDNRIDPYIVEALEFWIVDRYFAKELETQGETVFEFDGMRIWSRTTSGQSISMDYCTTQIVKNLDENHWVWRND